MAKGLKFKRVLLLMPNYRKVYKYLSEEITMVEPPLGLGYIAAFLRKNGAKVKILDAAALNLDYIGIRRAIESFKPEIVGMTATTIIAEEAYKTAKKIRGLCKLIVVGGPHPSIMPAQVLRECKEIDFAIQGEGEETMLEIIEGIPLNKIKGLSYRKSKKVITNQCREAMQNLDALPFPARDLMPLDEYFSIGIRRKPHATMITSRGCPYNCNFCVNHVVLGKKFRYRSVENVMEEIDELVKKFHVKEIDIIDDNFTLIPERAERICEELIKRKYDLIWKLGNGIRADRINEQLIRKMKKAGCYLIAFGIESGNEQILKSINKGESLEDIKKAVKLCKKYGIETEGFFIIGNLGDNKKTMQQTIDFAKRLDLNIAQFQVFIPIPGSEYTKIIEKEGKIFAKSWSDYGAFKKPIFCHRSLTPELMEKMQKKAYKEYYLRPKMIARKIFEIRSPRQFIDYARAGLAILKLQ